MPTSSLNAASAQKRKSAPPAGRKAQNSGHKRTLSRTRKPDDMGVEEWQIQLRRQHGREQKYLLKQTSKDALFGDYLVTNPATTKTYKVAIRSHGIGKNFCSCPDFTVNSLGTCKHVEFVLATLEGRRGFDASRAPVKGYSSLSLSYNEPRGVVFRPGSGCTAEVAQAALLYFNGDGRLRDGVDPDLFAILNTAAKAGHEVRCYDDALLYLARRRDLATRLRHIDALCDNGAESAIFKTLLKTELHHYQREGALFAARAGRAIIADEMGLGKTVQAIAAAEILQRCGGVTKILVIAPTSLKYQWQQEIARFSGRDAQVIGGLQLKRQRAYLEPSFYKITNYDVIHRDRDAIHEWAPDLIILDEAQRIKNWQTRAARSVKELESEFALVLTGTPLENRIEELHSIVQFVDRFRLGPLFRFQHEHRVTDETGAVTGYQNLNKVATTLQPILIRRVKKDVLSELPKRSDKTFLVEMTPQQMAHHDENREIVARLVAKWRNSGFLSDADQLRLRIALQYMRMSCDSTYLLDHKTDHSVKMAEAARILTDALADQDTKVVIFSQWLRTHELLIRRIEKKGWGYVFFNGQVPATERRELIRQFREDKACRIFLATDAGGVGLNLQTASVVMNMDLPWNPAVLEQRIGRVHRLGQERPVRVVNLVAENTIEQGMLGLLNFKTSLFAGVLDGGENTISLGGSRLKKFMESVEKVTPSVPTSACGECAPEIADTEPKIEETQAGHPNAASAPNAAGAPDSTSTPESTNTPDSQATHVGHPERVPVPGPVPARHDLPGTPGKDDAWGEIASHGLALVDKLAGLLSGKGIPASASQNPGAPRRPAFHIDRSSGRIQLNIPLPAPETMAVLGEAAKTLAQILMSTST